MKGLFSLHHEDVSHTFHIVTVGFIVMYMFKFLVVFEISVCASYLIQLLTSFEKYFQMQYEFQFSNIFLALSRGLFVNPLFSGPGSL